MNTHQLALRITRHGRPMAAYPVLIEAMSEPGRKWLTSEGYPANGIACGLTIAEEVAAAARAAGLGVEER